VAQTKKTASVKTTKALAKKAPAGLAGKTDLSVQTRNYFALENIQRQASPELKFYLFHAAASEIVQWGFMNRMTPETPKGIQRLLNRTKVRRLKDFLSYDGNSIATSVVVVLDPDAVQFDASKSDGSVSRHGKLRLKWKPKKAAGVIVDGQHRVIGAHEFQTDSGEDIHLNVVAIIGADDAEGAFQFLVINNNSSKVSTSQVKALFTSYKEEELLQRMLDSGSANIDSDKISALDYFDRSIESPFKGQLKWAKNKDGHIVPNALEAGLREVEDRSSLLAVQEVELDTFVGIWTAIKATWGHLWSNTTHLLEKASVQALSAYICETLEKMRNFADDDVDYNDPDELAASVKKVLDRIEPAFFDVQWSKTGLDTRAGQEFLIADLRQMASNTRNKKPWYSELETVSIGAVSGDPTKKAAKPKKVG
jgi:DGQHR domain-containing protein